MPNEIVEVLFRTERIGYACNSDSIALEPEMMIIVRVERGEDIAKVTNCAVISEELETQYNKGEIGKIFRVVTEEDKKQLERVVQREKEAENKYLELIKKYPFDMKLIDTIYQFDGNKLTFFFSAEGRIDFREFVRELANEFKTRIELHQSSGREDARRYGGLGMCGKTYCCVSWLKKFNQVSIQMAKEQNLLSNLSKISGSCGRLLCCLHYEDCFYKERIVEFPSVGEELIINQKKMRVEKNDFLLNKIFLKAEDKISKIISLEDYKSLKKK
ncbi:MAG: Tpl protein [Candidatus Cloacimonetes bacterium]|nr:Tpl protein [Candidatus Cloacimonadota bacterium]